VNGTLRVLVERLALVAAGVVLDLLWLPPGPAPWLVFVADAPFLWLLWHRGGRRWGWWAYLYGVLRFGVALRWLAEVHVVEVAIAALVLGGTYVAWGALLRFLVRRRIAFPLAVGATAVLQETFQAYVVVAGGMPWPARSLAFPAFGAISAASCELGAYGLSFFAAATSAWFSGLPAALRRSPYRRLLVERLAVAAIPLVLLGGAAWLRGALRVSAVDARIASGEALETRPLVIVQGNVAQSLKHAKPSPGREDPAAEVLATHVRLTRAALEDLRDHRRVPLAVLWPETMIPYPFLDPRLAAKFPDVWRSESNVITHLAGAVPEEMAGSVRYLVGANYYFRGKSGDPAQWFEHSSSDSLFFVDPSQASAEPPTPDPTLPTWTPPWEMPDVSRHDKVVLVPGGEYMPGASILPALDRVRSLVGDIPEITPGDPDQKPFLLAIAPPSKPGRENRRVLAGTVICFEIAFPARCRAWRREGATVLLNAGNYGWFGDTGMPAQVTALGRLRAQELGVTVAIAGNTGPSQILDPAGRVTAEVVRDGRTQFVEGWCAGPLWSDAGYETTYTIVGDWPWLVLGAGLVALALARGRSRGDRPVTDTSPPSSAPPDVATGGDASALNDSQPPR
jgi:apolipoprotein N-acyltransferase